MSSAVETLEKAARKINEHNGEQRRQAMQEIPFSVKDYWVKVGQLNEVLNGKSSDYLFDSQLPQLVPEFRDFLSYMYSSF